MNEQVLFSKSLQKFFAFIFHQEAPESLARAGDARLEETKLSSPLRIQQIIVRGNLSRLYQIGIVKWRYRKIRRERIDKPIRFNVVLPEMASPPLARVFDLWKN